MDVQIKLPKVERKIFQNLELKDVEFRNNVRDTTQAKMSKIQLVGIPT